MSAILLTAPATEPVSLTEAKSWLRVATSDDDDLIESIVTSARQHLESQTQRMFITQVWRLVFDAWPPDGLVEAVPAPLQSLDAVRVYDESGASHDIDLGGFVVDRAGSAIAAPVWTLPMPGRAVAGIEIDVTAGYGDDPSDVPAPLRQAIRQLVAHWYDNRGVVATGAESVLPAGVRLLIAPFRRVSL